MVDECTIPCGARALSRSLQKRLFLDELYRRLPVLGIAGLLLLAAPFVLLLAPGVTAVVLAGWALLGGAVVIGQSWLGAAAPARAGMQDELLRLIEANTARIHPPRLDSLRVRSAALTPGSTYFDTSVTHILQDLREATGEAWRCRCGEPRLPIPLPF